MYTKACRSRDVDISRHASVAAGDAKRLPTTGSILDGLPRNPCAPGVDETCGYCDNGSPGVASAGEREAAEDGSPDSGSRETRPAGKSADRERRHVPNAAKVLSCRGDMTQTDSLQQNRHRMGALDWFERDREGREAQNRSADHRRAHRTGRPKPASTSAWIGSVAHARRHVRLRRRRLGRSDRYSRAVADTFYGESVS